MLKRMAASSICCVRESSIRIWIVYSAKYRDHNPRREATTLRHLVDDAGFGAIEMHVLEVMRRMPASVASVVETMARAPYARDVAAVEEAVRQAIEQEVSAALHAYRDRDEVVIPHSSHLVQAQAA